MFWCRNWLLCLHWSKASSCWLLMVHVHIDNKVGVVIDSMLRLFLSRIYKRKHRARLRRRCWIGCRLARLSSHRHSWKKSESALLAGLSWLSAWDRELGWKLRLETLTHWLLDWSLGLRKTRSSWLWLLHKWKTLLNWLSLSDLRLDWLRHSHIRKEWALWLSNWNLFLLRLVYIQEVRCCFLRHFFSFWFSLLVAFHMVVVIWVKILINFLLSISKARSCSFLGGCNPSKDLSSILSCFISRHCFFFSLLFVPGHSIRFLHIRVIPAFLSSTSICIILKITQSSWSLVAIRLSCPPIIIVFGFFGWAANPTGSESSDRSSCICITSPSASNPITFLWLLWAHSIDLGSVFSRSLTFLFKLGWIWKDISNLLCFLSD